MPSFVVHLPCALLFTLQCYFIYLFRLLIRKKHDNDCKIFRNIISFPATRSTRSIIEPPTSRFWVYRKDRSRNSLSVATFRHVTSTIFGNQRIVIERFVFKVFSPASHRPYRIALFIHPSFSPPPLPSPVCSFISGSFARERAHGPSSRPSEVRHARIYTSELRTLAK